ncbi:hypothetical protein OROGR_024009 [Orobanche gracilis]
MVHKHTRRAPKQLHGKEGSRSPSDDGDWIVVKNQKIMILIPPLPNKAIPTTPIVGEGQSQENPRDTDSRSPKSVQETQRPRPLSPKQDARPPLKADPSEPNSTFQKPSGLSRKGIIIFTDSSAFLDRRMRSSYLERKLKASGGMENWLLSLGLGHFVKFFRTRSVNKFQLANITMKKLKDMGIVAVGPRRKLMHAIDCLCEPHCFQHV